ncbi:hypothetical protein [Streptomyces sp. NPDC048603]|uniref:hypothetical protein n=1 Tax=Streptomyces sp. NPDC048603 TaxID=3365577 RepID=UPI0037172833
MNDMAAPLCIGRRRRRILSFASGAVLIPAGVSACTRAPEPLLAVEGTPTGTVRLLMAPCPNLDVYQVSVFRDEEGGELEMWAATSKLSPGSPGQVELLSAPAGWQIYESTLKDLSRPGKYIADMSGAVEGSSLDGRVTFTAEELQELKSGQVITGIHGGKKVDRDKFMKVDQKRCDS